MPGCLACRLKDIAKNKILFLAGLPAVEFSEKNNGAGGLKSIQRSANFSSREVGMNRSVICLFSLLVVLFISERFCDAQTFRVGFPSLATGFAPSWVAADKGIWKK